MTNQYVEIGRLSSTVGLRGELKVYSYAQDIDRFQNISKLYIDEIPYKILSVSFVKSGVKIKLENIDTIDLEKTFVGKEIYIHRDDLEELEEGSFYIRDLVGFDVVLESGEKVGVLKDIKQDTPQDLYVVKTHNGDIYIPGVDEFIKDIVIEDSKIIVNLIEGLL